MDYIPKKPKLDDDEDQKAVARAKRIAKEKRRKKKMRKRPKVDDTIAVTGVRA